MPDAPSTDADRTIAALVAERIPDEATLQIGIGSVPEQVIRSLSGHRRLGVHTELMGEGFVDLIEAGVVTGECKTTHRHKAVTTSAIGTKRLYDFVADNPGVEFWPVDYTNDPRVIGRQHLMHVVNATLEVDFLGQCASESLGSTYWSSSGGQPDYARGAMFSEGGQSFIVLHSTNHDASVSAHRRSTAPGRRGDDVQERGRQGRDRVRRRRTARAADPGEDAAADRRCASRLPRGSRAASSDHRIPVGRLLGVMT